MSECGHEHGYWQMFSEPPDDQGGAGRHACAGCANERGFKAGLNRQETVSLDLDQLPRRPAGTVRHRSPHAAFARGHNDGVASSYSG